MLVLYFTLHKEAALAAALVSAGVDLVTLLQGYWVGTDSAIERWADDLAHQVVKTWAHRRSILLRDAGLLATRFERDKQLEDGELPDGLTRGDWNEVQKFFLSLPEQRLVILGDAGAGKTLITLALVIGLLRSRTDRIDEGLMKAFAEWLLKRFNLRITEEPISHPSGHVPVPISVVGWDGVTSLTDWLIGRLRTTYLIPRHRAAALIRNGLILPVLDGLDEATLGSRDRPTALSILYSLNFDFETTDSSGLRPLVLTCRTELYENLPDPGEARQQSNRLANAVVVRMKPLTESQVVDCLSRWARSANYQVALLVDLLVEGHHELLAKALSNPLTLTLALQVARSGNIDLDELEGLKSAPAIGQYFIGQYPRATAKLYPKDFGKKKSVAAQEQILVEQREEHAYYPTQSVQRWLYFLAGYLTPDHLPETPSIGRELDLEPRDYWEVVAAQGPPVKSTHLIVAVIGALITGTFGAEVAAGAAGLTCWLIATVLALGFALRVGLPQKPKMSRVDFRQLTHGKTAFYLLPTIAIAGLLAGLLAFRISHEVSVSITEGLSATALAVLLAGRSRGAARAIEPLDELSNDLRFGIVVGVVGGIAIGFPGGLTGGLWSHLHLTGALSKPGSGVLALLIAIPCGVALGSGGWLRLQIAAALSKDQFVPRRPISFLHWAEQTGLLRAAGTAFQFRHQNLVTWLLDHPGTPGPWQS